MFDILIPYNKYKGMKRKFKPIVMVNTSHFHYYQQNEQPPCSCY